MIRSTRRVLTIAIASLFAVAVQAQTPPTESKPVNPLLPDTLLTIKEQSNGRTEVWQMWIGAGRYRLQTFLSDDGVQIFRDDTLYLFNSDDNTYTALTHEQLVDATEKTRKFMPGQQRPAVQRELRETGRTTMMAKGWLCSLWEVFEDGVLTKEMCVVPFKLLATKESVSETIKRYNALFKDTDAENSSMPWSDAETMEGLPLLVKTYQEGKLHSQLTVLSMDTRAASLPQRYEIPAGMKKVTE